MNSRFCFVLMTPCANESIEVVWIFVHMHKQTFAPWIVDLPTDRHNPFITNSLGTIQHSTATWSKQTRSSRLWDAHFNIGQLHFPCDYVINQTKWAVFLFLSMKGKSIKEISLDCMSQNVLDGYTTEAVGIDWMMTQQRLLSFGNVSRKQVLTNNWLLRSLILWSPKLFR